MQRACVACKERLMKYVVILGDGMADWPIDELDGRTPLEYANTPFMDELSKKFDEEMEKYVSSQL